MEQFNRKRFGQVARYDLTINRTFYRNMAITIFAVLASVTLVGFSVRYAIKANADIYYAGVGMTALMLTWLMMVIGNACAGCIFHSLRNKQSRISSLTLPATNAEKFVWYAIVALGGGLLVNVASLLVCDGLNALLSLLSGFPTERIYSLTRSVWSIVTLRFDDYEGLTADNNYVHLSNDESVAATLRYYLIPYAVMSYVWTLTAYVYGNAIKYKYNILFTMLAMYVLQMVIAIIVVVAATCITTYANINLTEEEAIKGVKVIYYTIMLIMAVTAELMWRDAWRRYRRAQVTSRLNR